MPVEQGAAEVLARLRQEMGWEVLLFTHRPWPDRSTFSEECAADLAALWEGENPQWREPGKAITEITRRWLSRHSIPYDRLVVEGAVPVDSDAEPDGQDRFAVARTIAIKVFVEDDLGKVERLSALCGKVLLLDHPYNRCEQADLPNNVIRVKSWREVYEYVREVL
jgi:hypothetical protein